MLVVTLTGSCQDSIKVGSVDVAHLRCENLQLSDWADQTVGMIRQDVPEDMNYLLGSTLRF